MPLKHSGCGFTSHMVVGGSQMICEKSVNLSSKQTRGRADFPGYRNPCRWESFIRTSPQTIKHGARLVFRLEERQSQRAFTSVDKPVIWGLFTALSDGGGYRKRREKIIRADKSDSKMPQSLDQRDADLPHLHIISIALISHQNMWSFPHCCAKSAWGNFRSGPGGLRPRHSCYKGDRLMERDVPGAGLALSRPLTHCR